MQSLFLWFFSLPEECVVLFLRLPSDGSLVSCNAAMSILSLLLSLRRWWPFSWHHHPVIGHQRGLGTKYWHSSLLITGFIFFPYFFFAWCRVYSLLFGIYPKLQAPIEAGRLWRVSTLLTEDCPACAGDSWPMGLRWPLLPSEAACSAWAYANHSGLITSNCYLPCCFCHYEKWQWNDLSRAQAWVKCKWVLRCPVIRTPLLASLM